MLWTIMRMMMMMMMMMMVVVLMMVFSPQHSCITHTNVAATRFV